MAFVKTVSVDNAVQCIFQADVSQIGSREWSAGHRAIVNLGSQAIVEEKADDDRRVMASILKYNKAPELVYEILCARVWQMHVLPKMKGLDQSTAGIQFINAVWLHESAAMDLLIGVLMQPAGPKAVQSVLLDLLDYAVTGINQVFDSTTKNLATHDFKFDETGMVKAIHERNWYKLRFKNGMLCLSMLKALTDVDVCESGAGMYLLERHNIIELLFKVVHVAPWTRCTLDGLEFFMGKDWKHYEYTYNRFAPQEVHAWLCLFNLLSNEKLQAIRKLPVPLRCRLHDLGCKMRPVLLKNNNEIRRLQIILHELDITGPVEPIFLEGREPENCMLTYIIEHAENSLGGFADIARRHELLVRQNEEKHASHLNKVPLMFCPLDGNVADIKCDLHCDVHYCSLQCQMREWESHKPTCTAYANMPLYLHK